MAQIKTIEELKGHFKTAIMHGPDGLAFVSGNKAIRSIVSSSILTMAQTGILALGIVDYEDTAEQISDYIDGWFQPGGFYAPDLDS